MINANFYQHDTDRAALQALKALPGFSPLFKAFIKVFSEKQYRFVNLSTNLRISEKQLPEYYNMLPPICDKLGIDVPELYLKTDGQPNAYTAGDTKPFIVITTGLLKMMPPELIPTVLAHECGHIACHHVLYHTMGNIILSEAAALLELNGLAILPVKMAFAHWMRCSEFSADRAATICDGTSDKMVEVCMRLAGFGHLPSSMQNVQEFLTQAADYRSMVNDSTWNKILEFSLFGETDHPISAIRAYECDLWGKSERFVKINSYLSTALLPDNKGLAMQLNEIPTPDSSKAYIGKSVDEVVTLFTNLGFQKVSTMRVMQRPNMHIKERCVTNIMVDNKIGFNDSAWLSTQAEIVVEYYDPLTEQELRAAHPGQIRTPNSSKYYTGRDFRQVLSEFRMAGFTDIQVQAQMKQNRGLFSKNGEVGIIFINGQQTFQKGEWFPEEAAVRILYYTYPDK